MSIIKEYYDHICKEWGYTSPTPVSTGYENVLSDLTKFDDAVYKKASEADQIKIIDDVFDIYRSVNRLPITYYSVEECSRQVLDIASKSNNVKEKQLRVGANAGQHFCRFWFPNMQDATWHSNNMVGLSKRFYDDTRLKRAIRICLQHRDDGNESVLPKNLRRALDLVNGGTIANFKPMNARAIYEHICPVMWGNVLDFSSGYGGRMLGSMTSNMRYNYTGIDPNTKTYRGLDALGALLDQNGLGSGYKMHCIPSEQFESDKKYDAAFSSPPYFNLEVYTDEPTQCMNNYTTLDDWFDGYAAPTIQMVWDHLDNNTYYAVNIADYKQGKNEFKIVDDWISISEKIGFKYVEKIEMLLQVRPGVGNNKQDGYSKGEGVYVFYKK